MIQFADQPIEIEDDPESELRKTVVLGSSILKEVWADQDRLQLPSFMSPVPSMIGSKKGTLKADEWYTLATVHLVITLIRLWGYTDATDRRLKMLHNFMHLVTAVRLASMRTTSPAHISAYEHHYKLYLQGVVDLYKEAKISTNNHMGLHYGDVLRAFGPSHSIRTFVFERYNNVLQRVPTNRKSGNVYFVLAILPADVRIAGELEMTMMYHTSRAANLRPLLQNGWLPNELSDLRPSFDRAFRADFRGTRLNDMLSNSKVRVKESNAKAVQDPVSAETLSAYIASMPGSSRMTGASMYIDVLMRLEP